MAGRLLSCEVLPSLSVLRKAPQSPKAFRAGLLLRLGQSTTKTTITKKVRKRGARETVLVCLSSDVYTVYVVLLSDHQCSSYFSPFLFYKRNQQNLFCSLPHWVCCLFLKPGFLSSIDLSVWGKRIKNKKLPEEIKKGDYGCDLVWKSGPVFLGRGRGGGGDQAVVLDSYQWYSDSVPFCRRKATKRRGRERGEKWGRGE